MSNYLFMAIIASLASCLLFRSFYIRSKTTWHRAMLLIASIILTTPSFLILSYYLYHMPDDVWYINFRSLPFMEVSAGFVGALVGVIFGATRLRPRFLNISIITFSIIAASLLVFTPFTKQLLYKQDYSSMKSCWMNGICRQTSGSTCIPASCATVIRMLGGNVTERELAEAAGTTTTGTEIWYMKRVLRRFGYEMEVRRVNTLKDMQAPAVIGLGNSGHVVALISKTNNGQEIGDPAGGRMKCTWKAYEDIYKPKLIYFVIKPIRGNK